MYKPYQYQKIPPGKQCFLFRIPFLLLGVLFSLNLSAQVRLTFYNEIGKTNVSEGMYIKTAGMAEYKYKTHTFGIGGQIDLVSPAENRSPVFNVDYTKRFSLKSFPLDAKGFFLYNRYSERMYETDFGILASAERQHWTFKLGTSFRTFGMTKKAVEEYAVANDSKIHENFNTMYSLSGYLKPQDHQWNIGVTMANFDNFIILQETNPFFYIEARYRPTQTITIFINVVYMNAGAFNLSVNPFAYYFKTGIQWNINH